MVKKGERVLITTLTKRLAEELTDYLAQKNIKARYLHSDIDTIERTEIIRNLRLGKFDCLVGRITSYNVCYTKLLRYSHWTTRQWDTPLFKGFLAQGLDDR